MIYSEEEFAKVKKELEEKMSDVEKKGLTEKESYEEWKELNTLYCDLLRSQNRDTMRMFSNAILEKNAAIKRLITMGGRNGQERIELN